MGLITFVTSVGLFILQAVEGKEARIWGLPPKGLLSPQPHTHSTWGKLAECLLFPQLLCCRLGSAGIPAYHQGSLPKEAGWSPKRRAERGKQLQEAG